MRLTTIKQTLLAENPPVLLDRDHRLQNLDVLKLFCLFLVISLHCAGGCMGQHPEHPGLWTIPQLVHYLGVIAIPTFFMVSGYQLLGRDNLTYKYVLIKVMRLLKASAILYFLLRGVEDIFFGYEICLRDYPMGFVKSLFRFPGWSMFIFWFVGALILVYLVTPLVNYLYCRHKMGFLCLCAVLVILQSIVFYCTVVRPLDCMLNERSVLPPFRLWCWIGYFCLGGLVKRYSAFRSLGKLPYVLGLCVTIYLFMTYCETRRAIGWIEYYYVTLPVMVYVVALFMYVQTFTIDSKFVRMMVPLFFPVYLIDGTMLYLLENVGRWLSPTIYMIVICVLNIVCALGSAWLLMRIPFMRSLLKL